MFRTETCGCGGGTCNSGRGMDSGELAQYLCLRAPPCLSLCRCLNLLHSSNLHEKNTKSMHGPSREGLGACAASQLPSDRLVLSIRNHKCFVMLQCSGPIACSLCFVRRPLLQHRCCVCLLYCPTCKVDRLEICTEEVTGTSFSSA